MPVSFFSSPVTADPADLSRIEAELRTMTDEELFEVWAAIHDALAGEPTEAEINPLLLGLALIRKEMERRSP